MNVNKEIHKTDIDVPLDIKLGNLYINYQFGIKVNPMFKYGFGLNTGLYYIYGDALDQSVHAPFYLEYRFHIGPRFHLFIEGGAGFDWVFKKSKYLQPYNITMDVGGGFRFGSIQINAGTGFGMIDVSRYKEINTKKNKMVYCTLTYFLFWKK